MDARTGAPEIATADLEIYARRVVIAVLERLCVPFLLLDASGRIAFTSNLAEGLLGEGLHFAVTPEGLLELHSPAARNELEAFLTTLGHGRLDTSVTLSARDGSPPLFCGISAFTPPTMAGHRAMAPLAALFIREGGTEEGIAVAQARFGLTEAETAVLVAIVSRLTIAEHARRRGISIHTARKQLASVMEKLGATRQAQLVEVIDRLSGRGRIYQTAQAMAAANEAARAAAAVTPA